MATYEEKQKEPNTQKITLADVEASKRLVGWNLFSGSVYRIIDFDISIITLIEESGVDFTAVSDVASVVAGTFFNDRINKILYLETTGSVNPNGVFMVMTFKHFFSDVPVSLPFDLASGIEVAWLPFIRTTSKFGVELESEQIGLAIEGSGSIQFENELDFFKSRYDKLTWENQNISIFSLIDDLPATEAKKLFEGKIKGKSYDPTRVTFQVSDLLTELRGDFPLTNLEDIGGLRITNDLLQAKARRIYGRVFGLRATPIDQVLDGFPITGTIAVTNGSPTITGTGTVFLKEFSPNDIIIIDDVDFTIEDVVSDLEMTLGEDFSGSTQSGSSVNFKPDFPKPFINRDFKISGHPVREINTTVVFTDRLNRFQLANVSDLFPGDECLFGNGERVTLERINVLNNTIQTNENVLVFPIPGTTFKKVAVQNLRINNRIRLLFDRDFTFDSDSGVITLDELAEFNVTPIRILNGNVTFDGTRTVTGSGTAFEAQLQPGFWIRLKGEAEFFEILAIDSDTSLRLRVAATYSGTAGGAFKPVINFDEAEDILSCNLVGTTDDDTKSGNLLFKGPDIAQDILKKAGLTSQINSASFDTGSELLDYHIGLAIPTTFNGTETPIFRDLLDEINESIIGSIIQNNDFQLEYSVIRPKKSDSALKVDEADMLKFTVDTDTDRIIKTAIVRFLKKEHDFESDVPSFSTKQRTSKEGQFLTKITKTKTIETLLVRAQDAEILSGRRAFLLQFGSSILKLETSLQTSRLQVNDIISVFNDKLYERIGGGSRKIIAIQKISKSGQDVALETEDLSNAINRTGNITENDLPNFNNSTDNQKFFNSYITDSFGLINNDAETHGLNLIW